MDEDFDKAEFQGRVADEFYLYQSLNKAENFSLEDVEKGLRRSSLGCLFLPFTRLRTPYSRRVIRQEKAKHHYDAFQTQVNSLLEQTEIRNAMRDRFEQLPKSEIVTESVFIKTFTETLLDNKLREQFHIPLNATIFAMVGYGIQSKGLSTYLTKP